MEAGDQVWERRKVNNGERGNGTNLIANEVYIGKWDIAQDKLEGGEGKHAMPWIRWMSEYRNEEGESEDEEIKVSKRV